MLLPFDLGLVRSIHDSIHGTIKLSNQEMNVIEQPVFRRLHNVRQNSFLSNVFPTAKHTRFEHSIGVMHCAHLMLLAILENGKSAKNRNDIADEKQFREGLKLGVGVDLYQHLNETNVIEIFQDVRMAALLHDIGHGPLSHLFDSFAPTVDEFMNIVKTDQFISKHVEYLAKLEELLREYEKEEQTKGKKDIRVEHEHVSSYFTLKVLSKIDYSRAYEVLTILKPELALAHHLVEIYGIKLNVSQLLTDIVAGAPIDCDRMDYLKRDSASAGVPYGNYSEDRVLKTLLAYAGPDEKIHLGLKTSGLHAIESLLIARYQMYVQVYGHKTNEACNAMLEYIAKGERLPFAVWSGITLGSESFERLYIELSDAKFLEMLLSKLPSIKQQTILDLQRRNLWKRVYEVEEYVNSSDEETEVEKAFQAGFTVVQSEYGEQNFDIYKGNRFPLKDMSKSNKGAKLLEKNSHSYYVVSSKELKKSSQIINSLNRGLRILRIYSLNKDATQEYKAFANSTILPLIIEAEKRDEVRNHEKP